VVNSRPGKTPENIGLGEVVDSAAYMDAMQTVHHSIYLERQLTRCYLARLTCEQTIAGRGKQKAGTLAGLMSSLL
jgi:hypothetical protein